MSAATVNKFQEIVPIFGKNGVPVVFATDKNYLPFVSVAIQSIMENASEKRVYDIIVLATAVPQSDLNILMNMARKRKNFSIRCFDIGNETKNYRFKNRSYYTDAIYYRLFMPYIMRSYEKTVYLDCDLVVVNDIAKLYDYDIGDNLLGAVKDIGMIIYKYNKSELQYLPKNYFQNALPEVDIETYFNTGVLTLNLKEFRKNFELDYLIDRTNVKDYLYPDQDGLNIICRDKKCLLELGWNTYPYNLGARSSDYTENYLPVSVYKEYIAARKNPRIIHYNMLEKPWLHPCWLDHELMLVFWKFAAKTPFYDRILNYKPSEFYKKNNRAQIPYFEKTEINSLFRNAENKLYKATNDIHICSGDFFIMNLSDLPIKYETLDILDKEYVINASFTVGLEEYKHLDRVYFADEKNKKYNCILKEYGAPYCFGDKAIGQTFILTARIPNDCDKRLKLFFMLNKKPVAMKRFNFSRLFPIDRLDKTQFFFDKNKIVCFKNGELNLIHANLTTRLKYELKYDFNLLKSKNIKGKAAAFIRPFAKLVKHCLRKPIWIIGCNYMAEDNGFAFFKYMQARKDVKTYFAVNEKNSTVAKKVRQYGKVVDKYSKKFQWLTLISDTAISSIVDMRLVKPFFGDMFRDILMRRKFVFLQHGVTSQDQSREHNRFIYNPAIFCTCSQAEYGSIKNGNYFYDGKQVRLTGFPRYDYLYDQPEKVVAVMPTWRKYLKGDYGQHTSFYRFYHSLVHDERLQNVLKEHNYKLVFKPHPTVLKYINAADFNDTVADISYSELFAKSKLLITDYSSAAFDFLYLRKPVVYSQFDAEEFFSGKHVYTQGYIEYEKNGFGEVEYTLDKTVDRIIEYVENDCKIKPLYKERIDNFFAYNDKNNCKRVYDAIVGLNRR